jgi:hypothetical protein
MKDQTSCLKIYCEKFSLLAARRCLGQLGRLFIWFGFQGSFQLGLDLFSCGPAPGSAGGGAPMLETVRLVESVPALFQLLHLIAQLRGFFVLLGFQGFF